MIPLKMLSPAAIPAALAKAERYRLLNEPEQTESICEDVLRADPGNHQALVLLILALTDEFRRDAHRSADRVTALVAALPSEYERLYYGGLVAERRARAVLAHGSPETIESALAWLRDAMATYQQAERLRPVDNDETRLRWNACARLLNARSNPA
jgi:hypothetical protein